MQNVRISQAVVLAGGLGTRLLPLTRETPKPMVEVNGKPFLWYLLLQLKIQGISNVLLLTGYLHQKIVDYFGHGEALGLEISYSHGDVEWDTGRRLYRASHLLDETFFLLYSDNYINYNLAVLTEHYLAQQCLLSLLVVPKKNGNIALTSESKVACYDSKRQKEGLDYVELGFMCVNKSVVPMINDAENPSFSKTLQQLADIGQLTAYLTPQQYHSISDPVRLSYTAEFLKHKKLILLDRDGTINIKAPKGSYITSATQFEVIADNVAALASLGRLGFRFVVITNQAGLATGDLSEHQLAAIHEKMCQELAKSGIYIDAVYIAGAHWQDGQNFDRKPNPGLFLKVSHDFQLCLSQTWYIGDDPRDMQAARNAGCRGLFLGSPDELTQSLQEFIDLASIDMASLTDFIAKEYSHESHGHW